VSPETHEKISERVTQRLAQRPATYVVMRIVREVWKEREGGKLVCSPVPAAVLERSVADVSVLAGMVVDKFLYHLPLYRQHQRMAAGGVHLSRATLTNWVHGTAELVMPIYEAQVASILEGSVVTMDETPIKAGRAGPGKMKRGYFWPVYGDRDEVVFPFSPSRGGAVVREVLGEFGGVLVTDGYKVYEQYREKAPGLTHAQCWSHARRKFVEAQGAAPALCGKALEWIGALYRVEESLRGLGLGEEKRLQYRAEHAKPVVDGWFEWLEATVEEEVLLPSDPFLEAANYSLKRKEALRVFLENPDVPLDTNHLERQIRSIAVGRRNWLFCWTEVGARYVGVLQSLIATCRLQRVDPYTYLVDVLQRIHIHPQSRVRELTPRLWKERFADTPLRSFIDGPRSP
jgi:transposase